MWQERRTTNGAPVWDLMCCDVDYSVPPSSISPDLSLLDDTSSLPPPSLPPICSPPSSLSYLLWVKLQHAAAAATLSSVWSLISDSHHFCQSQFIILNISLSHSIHLSLSLHLFICFVCFYGGEEVICGRDGADVGFDADCNIPPSPSVTVYHFSPSALTLRPSHVYSVRGGCDRRIIFCWCNRVIMIATSHHFCPAEFIISWWFVSPLLSFLSLWTPAQHKAAAFKKNN